MVVISRRLPKTDTGRKRALNAADAQMGRVAPADMALTPATQARVTATNLSFPALLLARAVALATQGSSTSLNEVAKELARMFISHFFQVFFLGVERGVYPSSAKSYYSLDLSANAVPSLASEADIRDWGANIKNGDIARLAAGGAAMSNPTTAQVNAVVDAFVLTNNSHAIKKSAYDTTQEDVENSREDVDKLIKKIWDEIETFYDEVKKNFGFIETFDDEKKSCHKVMCRIY